MVLLTLNGKGILKDPIDILNRIVLYAFLSSKNQSRFYPNDICSIKYYNNNSTIFSDSIGILKSAIINMVSNYFNEVEVDIFPKPISTSTDKLLLVDIHIRCVYNNTTYEYSSEKSAVEENQLGGNPYITQLYNK